ncbi:hypothetical protein ACIREK_28780 [Streptomyces sp. NPDC102415]
MTLGQHERHRLVLAGALVVQVQADGALCDQAGKPERPRAPRHRTTT